MGAEERWRVTWSMIRALEDSGNRAWRTHVQKLLYFAKSWGLVDVEYKYIIHRFGPYSFGLDRDLSEMESYGLLEKRWGEYGLGAYYRCPRGADTSLAGRLQGLAEWLGPKGVKQLEVLATAQYVLDDGERDPVSAVRALKPHVEEREIREALQEIGLQRVRLTSSASSW